MPEREYLVRDSNETEKTKAWLVQEGEENIKSIGIHRQIE